VPRRYLPRRRLDDSAEQESASTGTIAPVVTDERSDARLTELLITKGPESRNGNGGAVPRTSVARLQRLAGNRAVADRLGGSGATIQRARNRASDEEDALPEPAQAGPAETVEAAPESEAAPSAQAGPVETVEAAPESEAAPSAQAGPVEAAPDPGVAPPAQAGPVEAMAAPNAEEAAKAAIKESARKPAGATGEPAGLDKLVEGEVPSILDEGGRVLPGPEIKPEPGAETEAPAQEKPGAETEGPGSPGELADTASGAAARLTEEAGGAGPTDAAAGGAAEALGAAAARGAQAGRGTESVAGGADDVAERPVLPESAEVPETSPAGPGGDEEAAEPSAGPEPAREAVPGGDEEAAEPSAGPEPADTDEGRGAMLAEATPSASGPANLVPGGPTADELESAAGFARKAENAYALADTLMTASETAVQFDANEYLPARIQGEILRQRGPLTTASIWIARNLPAIGTLARQGLAGLRAGLQAAIGAIGGATSGLLRAIRDSVAGARLVIGWIRSTVGGVIGQIASYLGSVGAAVARILGPLMTRGQSLLGDIRGRLDPLRNLVSRVVRPMATATLGVVDGLVRGLDAMARRTVTQALDAATRRYRTFVDAQVRQARAANTRARARIAHHLAMFRLRSTAMYAAARHIALGERVRIEVTSGRRVRRARTASGYAVIAQTVTNAWTRITRRDMATTQPFGTAERAAARAVIDAHIQMDADVAALEASKATAVEEATATATAAAEDAGQVAATAADAAVAVASAAREAETEATGLVSDLVGQGETEQSRLQGTVDRAGTPRSG